MLVSVVVAIHVTVCITLCVIILLQQGKGAEIGAVFGGSSQTVFGATGAGNILTKLTSALAVVFFLTSIYLAYASTRRATGSIFSGSAASAMQTKAPQTKAAPVKAATPPAHPASAPVPSAPASGK